MDSKILNQREIVNFHDHMLDWWILSKIHTINKKSNLSKMKIKKVYKKIVILNHSNQNSFSYLASKINKIKELFKKNVKL